MDRRSILYVFRQGRQALLSRCERRESPDDMLYGLRHMASDRYEVSFIESSDHLSLLGRLWKPYQKRISRQIKMGFRLELAVENLSLLRRADVIITTVDACGLPVAMLKRYGVVRTPVIYISQGLSDRVELAPATFREKYKRRYGRYLGSLETLKTLGEGASRHVESVFGFRAGRASTMPFGVDVSFWRQDPGVERAAFVLSVGSDAARDYETLLRAVGRRQLKIVTRQVLPSVPEAPVVETLSAISDIELRELYQRCSYMVVPLKDVAQPSGQSATMQAMACGCPVILTQTKGFWEPEYMRHGDNCWLVPPQGVVELKEAMTQLENGRDKRKRIGTNARKTVEGRYTSQHVARCLESDIEELLNQAGK